MREVKFPYGKGEVGLSIPERNVLSVLDGRLTPSVPLEEEFERAWKNPFRISDPAGVFNPGESVVFVVTDHTRSTPTREILPLIWERIEKGVSPEDATILVATGIHRPPRDDRRRRIGRPRGLRPRRGSSSGG